MNLEERFELAQPSAVWDFLMNPRTLAQAIPTFEELVAEDERTFRGEVFLAAFFSNFLPQISHSEGILPVGRKKSPSRFVKEL